MRSFFFYISHPYKIFLFFENICEYYQGSSNGAKHSFCFGNRLSDALWKYPNLPALLREEKRPFFFYVSHPYKIFLFFENLCEYYQGTTNALSTVFVLITDFLMPFQNTLINRLSSAEKCDHFLLCLPPLENVSIFWERMWILSRF